MPDFFYVIRVYLYITAINSFFKFANCNVKSSSLSEEIIYLINSWNESIIFPLSVSVRDRSICPRAIRPRFESYVSLG